MTAEVKCEKFPSLLKAHCSHCQGLERGTDANPKYSLKEGFYRGFPVVEVLKNGGSIHIWDNNFRFGVRKAQMLMACVDILREFWRSTDEQRSKFKPRTVEDQSNGLHIGVEMFQEFELSNGITIQSPFLRLEAFPPERELDIGIGLQKCRAICEVEEDLKHWIVRH